MGPLRLALLSITSLILLVSCCSAADTERASSSAAQLTPNPPRADRYIHQLDFSRIRRLPSSFARGDDPLNPRTPFFGRTPLFSVRTAPAIVEQALRDHGSVGIVDRARQQAMEITLDEGHLSQQPYRDMRTVTGVYWLDGKIHHAKKALYGQVDSRVRGQNVDVLPHASGIPVLVPGFDSVEHIVGAARQDGKAFYYRADPSNYLLIKPQTETMYTVPSERVMSDINAVVRRYRQDTDKYGRATASLISGRPLHNTPGLQQANMGSVSLVETSRFASGRATRDELVQALQTHGRFHLYAGGPGQGDKAYKIKLVAKDTPVGRVLAVQVKPLSRFKRMQERVLEAAGKIRIPG